MRLSDTCFDSWVKERGLFSYSVSSLGLIKNDKLRDIIDNCRGERVTRYMDANSIGSETGEKRGEARLQSSSYGMAFFNYFVQ